MGTAYEMTLALAGESLTYILDEGAHPVTRAIEVSRSVQTKLSFDKKNHFWPISQLKTCIFHFFKIFQSNQCYQVYHKNKNTLQL